MLPPGQPWKYSRAPVRLLGHRRSAGDRSAIPVPSARGRWKAMRELLELLGLVSPPRGRREPVALPAWARWLLPATVAALAAVSLVVLAFARVALR